MSAHANDLRYFYSEHLGSTVVLTGVANNAVRSVQLEQGRYMFRILNFDAATGIWVRQGDSAVVAAAAAPAALFLPTTDIGLLNRALFTFMVRGTSPSKAASPGAAAKATADDFISVFQVAGATADIQITKISRDKG